MRDRPPVRACSMLASKPRFSDSRVTPEDRYFTVLLMRSQSHIIIDGRRQMNFLLLSILGALLMSISLQAGADRKPGVVFMIGEKEYDTAETLPQYAREVLIPAGFDCLFIHVNQDDPNDFPGLVGALEQADVLFISVRRRTPPMGQMQALRNFIDRGGAVIGIRTASHAFGREPARENQVRWDEFDRDVFGMDYEGHYSNKPPEDPPTEIRTVSFWKSHPILRDLPGDSFVSTSHLYRNRLPENGVSILMTGSIDDDPARTEPVAWTSPKTGGRVFYTSLGNPDDFRNPVFRKLILNAVTWAAAGN